MRSAWKLFRAAVSDYRKHWRLFSGIVLTVSVPVALASTYLIDPAADSTLSAYLTFAQLVMNSALIYGLVQLFKQEPVSIKQAYYQGSVGLVRLVLVSFLLIMIGLLLVLSLAIIGFGLISPGTSLSGGEKLLVGIVALLPLIPGAYLLARTFLSLYIIFEGPQGPVEAVGRSWDLTRRHGFQALGKLILLGLMLLLAIALPAAAIIALQAVTNWTIFNVLLQLAVALVVLPLSNLYLYRYYLELKGDA